MLLPSPRRSGLTRTGVKMSFHFWKSVFAKYSVLSVTEGTNTSSSSSSSCWSCSFLVYNYNATCHRKDPFHLNEESCEGLAGTSTFLHFISHPQNGMNKKGAFFSETFLEKSDLWASPVKSHQWIALMSSKGEDTRQLHQTWKCAPAAPRSQPGAHLCCTADSNWEIRTLGYAVEITHPSKQAELLLPKDSMNLFTMVRFSMRKPFCDWRICTGLLPPFPFVKWDELCLLWPMALRGSCKRW